ncbi:double-strand break repair protein AddB [Primorskyibacter aestuariivivens]|uniref:double-strand break repair protein AddB n=1 Tax=Primorskyibacter aestuariivivens TaxID=1888912 RepID=UPI0022FFD02E|nr:double-strand break repair protein AddB [Primorskyibacter aestuariivivens]MDA7427647.1 double-strand break repair protein AddB [Primorskyibacter aestuariivivens]
MFEPQDRPRVFGLAPGVDFPQALVDGLRARMAGQPPEAMARVELIVNTERMRRRIRAIFDAGPPAILPRIRVLGEVAPPWDAQIPDAVPALQRRLELVQLVSKLLEQEQNLAPRAALFDLADSLAGLMDEMQGEGVTPDDIAALDVSDQSGHWQRAQKFLSIVQAFMQPEDSSPDATGRQRLVAEALAQHWKAAPPAHPVIVAGSTGSRGATALLMWAVAKLPQGALILPGFDFEMAPEAWGDLDQRMTGEDHPQFRFAQLMRDLEISAGAVAAWHAVDAPCPSRNRLVSLALRPAPVTHAWLSEGPKLRDLDVATENVTLIEAQSRREEATTIALRLRKAAEDGVSAALITPDRQLTRQVTAALDQWGIVPDDSAGIPLQLTPPGRFLRHVAALFARPMSAEALLALLKHPLCHTGDKRNEHLRMTRDLELHLRRNGPPFPGLETIQTFAATRDWPEWGAWLSVACDRSGGAEQPLENWLDKHRQLAEALAAGTGQDGAGQLWAQVAGTETLGLVRKLQEAAPYGGVLSARDYVDLFNAILAREEQRDRDLGHPLIRVWGTLEARVMGAELLILSSLNEGSWPEPPAPDPWLNRSMRDKAGLLLPERRIGLSAHDFQQAIGAQEVWLTRSVRSDDAETVPSRWLNRLNNLLGGLGEAGQAALKGMRARGAEWLALNRALEEVTPVAPAARPSPKPPAAVRPKKLSVTEIKRLIRDPYAIYARHVLRLRPLDPLAKAPDALLRGILAHGVMEDFIQKTVSDKRLLTRNALMSSTADVLAARVPWPAARVMWQMRMDRIADGFIEDEKARQDIATPVAYEVKGGRDIEELGFRLTCEADRIDRKDDGDLILYDYKTGAPPTKAEQEHFDKQLLLEAAIAEQGGFDKIDAAPVADAIYIGLGSKPGNHPAPLDKITADQVWTRFEKLIAAYMRPEQGFTARRSMHKGQDHSDYDQLARFGEWDSTAAPVGRVVE